jgi:succinate dehydrogenase / fumarate reductase, cytochrome b subunit
MNWLAKFFVSSIGQKTVVGGTGLFLILFLTIHALGNSQLFISPDAFNHYAHVMENNPLIIYVARYMTFAAFLLHAFRGLVLAWANRKARGEQGYAAVAGSKSTTWASRNMAILGSWILIFWALHLYAFWWKLMLGQATPFTLAGEQIPDVYLMVKTAFHEWWIALFYVLSMVMLSFHLQHGFQSAFQTFGLSHPKYSPIVRGFGAAYSIIVPLIFAMMPIYFYFFE